MTNDLRVLPFFQPFEDSALHTTNVMLQMSYALRAQLLADAIPALSFAVGANPVFTWKPDPKKNVERELIVRGIVNTKRQMAVCTFLHTKGDTLNADFATSSH